jgi:hypothetical protein
MINETRFYFANLTADVTRAARAARDGDTKRYTQATVLAYKTLKKLRATGRQEAYDEGLLLMSDLRGSKETGTLDAFMNRASVLGAQFTPIPLDRS